jgi:hypothetical protein
MPSAGARTNFVLSPQRRDQKQCWLRLIAIFCLAVCFAIAQTGCTGIATSVGNSGDSLNISAPSLNFGNVGVGASIVLRETLTNNQRTSINISNVVISGPGFNVSGISTGSIIESGQSAAFDVSFAPPTDGNLTGSITLISDAKNQSLTIPLAGSGVHSVSVSWDAGDSGVNGYAVYRGTISGGPYTRVGLVSAVGTRFLDASVLAGLTYYYVVTAVLSNGAETAFSNEASISIPPP